MKTRVVVTLLALCFAGISGVVGPISHAQAAGTTLYWVGTGNWSTAANWSPASVPADGDSLVFPLDDQTVGPATNDMTGLTLDSVSWANDANSAGCNGPTAVDGNSFTLTGPITAGIWCYNSPPIPLDTPVILASGSHAIGGVQLDDAVSGPGSVVIDGGVNDANSTSNTYTGGTTLQGGTLDLEPLAGAVSIPASPEPITVENGDLTIATDGAIAPSDSLDIANGSVLTVNTATATVPVASLINDGVIYLDSQLEVGNLDLGSDGILYPYGRGTASDSSVGIIASGQVIVGGTLSFDEATFSTLPPAFLLIHDTSRSGPTGTFTGDPSGTSLSTFGNTPSAYTIAYGEGSGHDVALTSSENSLTVSFDNTGDSTATVTSVPAGISCPGTCTATFPLEPVTLTATAASGDVVTSSDGFSNSGDGCSPVPPVGTYAVETCTLTVDGGSVASFDTTPVTASLVSDGAEADSTNKQLDSVLLDACGSTGAATYQFSVDSQSIGGPNGGCQSSTGLALGEHTATVEVASSDGKVTSSESIDFEVSAVASFSWQVTPVPYGSSVDSTTVNFNACASAGVALYQWNIQGSNIPLTDISNCHYSVTLPTRETFKTTLTIISPNSDLTSTSAEVTVNSVYEEPSGCSNFSVSANACWRVGADWFGDITGISGNPMRPPDYMIAEVSGGEFGTGGGNVAVTCDGNVYVGINGGFTLSALPVSGVLSWGYVGDPTTVAPTMDQIDAFVDGETDSAALSEYANQDQVIYSPLAADTFHGPTIGVEYGGGLVGPGVSLTASYDHSIPGDTTPPASETCNYGVTGSATWAQLGNIPVGSPSGVPSFNPLSGQSPVVGQGVSVYLTVPAGTFAPGTDVEVAAHSAPLVPIATVTADETGRIGELITVPTSLAAGDHTLILTGVSKSNPMAAATLTMNFAVEASSSGYRLVASDGGVFSFGDAQFYGSLGGTTLNKPIVAMAATPDGKGYWLVASDGGVFAYGDAAFYGSLGGTTLNKPIVAMAATPDGKGYWLVASDGGLFAYGDAAFYGSLGGTTLNKPIVAMAATPDGKGYWLVASDGGLFAYGDAAFYGSLGGTTLNKPIVAMAATPDGKGYWLVASDGGVFAYGDAAFYGSLGGTTLNKPIVAMAATPDGKGYWLVASDGGVFAYGDAAFYGSLGGTTLNKPIVGAD